jgi:hypothetical protein
VIDNGAGLLAEIVIAKLTDLLCAGALESVTENVSIMALAAAVGVPLRTPVDAFIERPVGSVPELRAQV